MTLKGEKRRVRRRRRQKWKEMKKEWEGEENKLT
jgi:hypothetical protein